MLDTCISVSTVIMNGIVRFNSFEQERRDFTPCARELGNGLIDAANGRNFCPGRDSKCRSFAPDPSWIRDEPQESAGGPDTSQ